jgi:ribosomal protein S21
MQALRGAAARLATLQRALPLLPAWALPALPASGANVAPAAALAACRGGATRGLFGRAGALLPPAAAAAFVQRPGAPPGAAPGGARGVISVPVDYNNIDKAMRKLKRRMIEEGMVKELKERQHYTKPSQMRVRPVFAQAVTLAPFEAAAAALGAPRPRMRGATAWGMRAVRGGAER